MFPKGPHVENLFPQPVALLGCGGTLRRWGLVGVG